MLRHAFHHSISDVEHMLTFSRLILLFDDERYHTVPHEISAEKP
jgi:hypothetical protein